MKKETKQKNLVVLLGLVGVIVLMFFVTLVKIKSQQ